MIRSSAVTLSAMLLGALPAAGRVVETSFTSGDAEIRAYLHHDPERTPRALAIYLHGNPGGPLGETSPFADALTSVGVDVFRFNYRGLWGNAGDFTLTDALGDLRAALDYLTSEPTTAEFGLDPTRIILMGYSFGTATALIGSSRDDRVHGVVSLAPCDHGYFGTEWLDPDSEVRAFLETVTEELFGENGAIDQDASIFVDDLTGHAVDYSFVGKAPSLAGKKLLFLVGSDDVVCFAEDHFFPLYRELRALNHPSLEAHVLAMDHGFGDVGLETLLEMTTDWIRRSFPEH